MACILRAGGVNFDVDEFLVSSTLVIDSSWRKGERRFPSSITNEDKNSSSGLRVVASDADFASISVQIEAAVEFLKQNLSEVQRLSSHRGVEWALLDFGAEIRPPGWASFTFPVELLRLASAASVEVSLSVYPNEDEGESDA